MQRPKEQLSADDVELVDIAKAAARALWSVSKSRKNIHVMMKSGSIPLLARLLRYVLRNSLGVCVNNFLNQFSAY